MLGGLRLRELVAARQGRTKQFVIFNIFSTEKNIRIKIGKRIRNIFANQMQRIFGGYIERLKERTDDGNAYAIYRVMVVADATANGMENDADFLPLWKMCLDEFVSDIAEAEFGLLRNPNENRHSNPDIDPKFATKFYIHKLEEEGEDWSDVNLQDFDDNASNFSVEVLEII
jgi:hypothetical protein